MDTIKLAEKMARLDRPWPPKVIAELNDQHIKLARLEGEFVWHHHEHEDELFLVLQGRLTMHLRDRVVELREGEMCVVPRGVEHKPAAPDGAIVLLMEPATTLNTGNVRDERTVHQPERI